MKSDSRRGVKRGDSNLPPKPTRTISKKNRSGVQSSSHTQDSASPTQTLTEEEVVDMPNGKQSDTWTNFRPVVNAKGLKKLECIHCGTLLDAKTRISSVTRHSLSCKKNRDITNSRNIQPTSDDTMDLSNWQFNEVRLRKKIAEMIILDELPLGFVEMEGFNKVMQAACPMFQMPSKSTIKEDCLKLFLDEKAGVTTVVDDRTSADCSESSSNFVGSPPSGESEGSGEP